MWEYNYTDELMHYGVKGMKWGVRKDGRHSTAAHEDYRKAHSKASVRSMSDAELKSRNARLANEEKYKSYTRGPNKVEKSKKLAEASGRLVDDLQRLERETRTNQKPTRKKLNLSSMSDAQLRERINRANLERQYNELFSPEVQPTVSKGRKFVSGALSGLGTALAITSSSLGIALAVKELKG